mmetsp:Transcript_20048/g.57442  ORF Transcript_20048/g.57442 Transcript_20048/m.57442 type:complete len:122 (+) Transcript_20048:301-666(+)
MMLGPTIGTNINMQDRANQKLSRLGLGHADGDFTLAAALAAVMDSEQKTHGPPNSHIWLSRQLARANIQSADVITGRIAPSCLHALQMWWMAVSEAFRCRRSGSLRSRSWPRSPIPPPETP